MQMLFNAAGATFANRTSPLSKAALLLGASLLPNAALAQDADEARVQEVSDQIIVTGESIDQYDVLPDRLSDSTFGTLRELEETPRSVSLVESSLIELFGIQSVNDFVAITPGTFTGNYFGIPGALDIRGERADNFFRGFRRIENRGNFPTAVQASEYVEIVKGPPPVIYGGGQSWRDPQLRAEVGHKQRQQAGRAHWRRIVDCGHLWQAYWYCGIWHAV